MTVVDINLQIYVWFNLYHYIYLFLGSIKAHIGSRVHAGANASKTMIKLAASHHYEQWKASHIKF